MYLGGILIDEIYICLIVIPCGLDAPSQDSKWTKNEIQPRFFQVSSLPMQRLDDVMDIRHCMKQRLRWISEKHMHYVSLCIIMLCSYVVYYCTH